MFKGQRGKDESGWNSQTGTWKAGKLNTTKPKTKAFQEGGGGSTTMLQRIDKGTGKFPMNLSNKEVIGTLLRHGRSKRHLQ